MTDWVAGGVGAAVALATGALSWVAQGARFHQKVEDLREKQRLMDERQQAHEHEIAALRAADEASRASVASILDRITDQNRFWEVQINRVGDQLKSAQELTNHKLDAVHQLAVKDLEQMRYDVRGLTAAVEGLKRPMRRDPRGG